MVQVENSPQSRPHSGLQHADLVYEYLTEGGITRFTAIYMNPGGSDTIGPVRSARLVTLRLQKAYGGVLFYSGASTHVLDLIHAGNVQALDEPADGGSYFFRDHSRQAPHNLYTSADRLAAGVAHEGTKITYSLPAAGEPPASGEQVGRISFQMTSSHEATFTYSASGQTYGYSSETGPEVDVANGEKPLAISSVILIRVSHHDAGYVEDVLGEDGIDFDLTGTGPADVYSRGRHQAATWNTGDGSHPIRFTTSGGKDLALPAGLTWICLVDPDLQVTTG
jgi:Protein of unknown function (DUF3048) N-terminal domain/Protein of unknown function (DUF3048) C-terminal domain